MLEERSRALSADRCSPAEAATRHRHGRPTRSSQRWFPDVSWSRAANGGGNLNTLTCKVHAGEEVEVVIVEVAGTSGDDGAITCLSFGHARAGANGLYSPKTSGSTLACVS